MQSFVILIGQGYSSAAKSAFELFDIVTTEAVEMAPPYEVEVIVANGPRIMGDVLIFYFDNSFASYPPDIGSSRFYGKFFSGWLRKIIREIDSADYCRELYGPRYHGLNKYWPGINIVRSKRLIPKS